MKTHSSSLLRMTLAAITALLVLLAPLPASALVSNQSLAVPLFQSPSKGSFWKDVTGAGSASVPFVVANPNNGPGTKVDPAYTSALGSDATAGIRTLGYVQTNYQKRDFKAVRSDVDTWYRLYPSTGGIFVDSIQESTPENLCYVAALYTHEKNVHVPTITRIVSQA